MNDAANLKWLVEKRNEIQLTALELLKLLKNSKGKNLSLAKQDLVGVTFSLWRGVFLAYNKGNDIGGSRGNSEEFLEKVITDNAITFSDDKTFSGWTANYYVDNAGRILAGFPPRKNSKSSPRCEAIKRMRLTVHV